MAFLGADTDELREVGQEFQDGKEVTDQVITYLQALIAILKAASFFSGGASLAYAEYLETTVVPWLKKISMALGLFAKVLGTQADAQDEASNGGTVDMGSLPTYQSPSMPEAIQPFTGGSIVGGATPTSEVPTTGTGDSATTNAGAPLGNATTTTPSLSIGDNGHLMIDTGIDLDGDTATPTTAATTPVGGAIGAGTPGGDVAGTSQAGGVPTIAGRTQEMFAGANSLTPEQQAGGGGGGSHLGSGGGIGSGGGGGSLDSGSGGGSGGGSGSASPALGSSSIDGSGSTGSPVSHGTPLADGGMGGGTPGAASALGGGMGSATPVGTPESGGASYGAAAGIAGGAAALGLGGAALASRGGSGSDPAIDKLASSNGRGSRGTDVQALQEKLTAAGYDTKGADGVWGSNTQAAYDAYRGDNPLPVQAGSGYTSPSGYDYNSITGVRGNPNVTPEFLRSVEGMSQRLGAQPEHIMAAMSFETGGEFSSDVRNPRSSATGLIQFMDSTAQGMGTTTADLARMTPTEQLTYVERYFEPHRGHLGSLESVYTSILAGHPASGDTPLFTEGQGRSYAPNRELDVNHNGVITAAEATAHVRARMGTGSN